MSENFLWSSIKKFIGKKDENLRDILKEIPLFANLSSSALKKVETICYLRYYKPEEIIFYENEPGNAMYIIKEGKVKIFCKNKEGEEKELAELTSGDFFGEITLLDESFRNATAVSVGKSEIIGIHRSDLLDLVKRNPGIGYSIILKLAQIIAMRLKMAEEKLKEL